MKTINSKECLTLNVIKLALEFCKIQCFTKSLQHIKNFFILKMFKKVVYNEKRMGIIPVVDSDICQLSKAGRRNGIEITSRDISNTTFAILV